MPPGNRIASIDLIHRPDGCDEINYYRERSGRKRYLLYALKYRTSLMHLRALTNAIPGKVQPIPQGWSWLRKEHHPMKGSEDRTPGPWDIPTDEDRYNLKSCDTCAHFDGVECRQTDFYIQYPEEPVVCSQYLQ